VKMLVHYARRVQVCKKAMEQQSFDGGDEISGII
jgi:hypothetical protein